MHTLTEAVRKVSWLELFFDLVFVAAVAQVAAPLAHAFTPAGLGRFALLFVLIWWAWLGQTVFATRFGDGSRSERVLTFVQICAAAAMAVNAQGALDSRDSAGFAAAYAVMRLVLALQYAQVLPQPGVRGLVTRYLGGCTMSGVLWLVSAVVPAPARFAFWLVALAVDVATPLVAETHGATRPPHDEHLPERFGLFTIILLGEAMTSVMRGMQRHETWPAAAALSVLAGLLAVFLVWWWYFHGVGVAAPRPIRTRRHVRQFLGWSYAHVPLYIGVAVLGIGFEHVIVSAAPGLPDAALTAETAGALGVVAASLWLLRGLVA